jgi:secreted trypsin-like serine protease
MKARMAAIAVVLGVLGLGACGGGDEGGGPTPAASTNDSTTASLPEAEDGSKASSREIPVEPGVVAVVSEAEGQPGRKAARIISGSAVTIEQYPWQVGIAQSRSAAPGETTLDRHFCGGTLVAPTIVLSAAHCLYDLKQGGFYDASRFTVISGRTELNSDQGVEIPFSRFTWFKDTATGDPLFDLDAWDWDVVVIELAVPAFVGEPLKIAGDDEAEAWAVGSTASVSGWGSTDDNRPNTKPNQLHATNVMILDDARCSRYPIDSETSLCAGALVGEFDTCVGDSGGPLVVTLPTGERRLVGATSYGGIAGPGDIVDCGRGDAPGVYTRLAADPVRSSVQEVVQEWAGVDIIGGS